MPSFRCIAFSISLLALLVTSLAEDSAKQISLIDSISKHTIWENRDGMGTTWFHPKATVIPSEEGAPSTVLMTLQEIGGSDYFGPVHWTTTSDQGRTWSEPQPVLALDQIPVPGHEGLMAGVCDVVPEYHPQTGTVLGLGQVVFYRRDHFSSNDQLARYPVYSVRNPEGNWGPRKILRWEDPRGSFIYSNNCGQRVTLSNGDVLLAFSFGAQSASRSVASVLCSFDGQELKVKQVGEPLELEHGRGLLEPSLTQFRGRFYLTLRAEDGKGYLAVSRDGLLWEPKEPWRWDTGETLALSSTQQHWLPHSDGLFLVYTRQDQQNQGVIRWRAPLWIARVDLEKPCLIRSTERVLLPLVGEGVDAPDQVALMGNFHITNVSSYESWVSVGEWIPKDGARGDLLLSKITWKRPNRLVSH